MHSTTTQPRRRGRPARVQRGGRGRPGRVSVETADNGSTHSGTSSSSDCDPVCSSSPSASTHSAPACEIRSATCCSRSNSFSDSGLNELHGDQGTACEPVKQVTDLPAPVKRRRGRPAKSCSANHAEAQTAGHACDVHQETAVTQPSANTTDPLAQLSQTGVGNSATSLLFGIVR